MAHAILTAIGADRPGLVDEVSRFIFDQGGNIEDSRMVNLGGQFAIMLLVAGSDETLSRLRAGLGQLASNSRLHAELRATAEPAGVPASAEALPYRLLATTIDQPGIVHRVSHALQEMRVNIESLDTHLTPAPYTGSPMFEMELIVAVPKSTPIAQLRSKLGTVCEQMNIDWELSPL